MNELVDRIASPSVKPLLERQLDLGLDTPGETPDDHAKMLREGVPASLPTRLMPSTEEFGTGACRCNRF